MKEKKNRKLFSIFDLICILVIVLITAFCVLIQFNNDKDLVAVVRVKGETVDKVELSTLNESLTKTYEGDLEVSIEFSNNSARVLNSQCPDKLCVHTGVLNKIGESSVCLPAKVSVTIEGEDTSVDALLR